MKYNTIKSVILLIVILSFYACSDSTSPENGNNDTTNLTGSYMGQTLPGLAPVRFSLEPFLANSIWFYHGPLTFSQNGQEMFWAKYITATNVIQLSYAAIENGYWTEPRTPSFALSEGENCPIFSYTNPNKLYYLSRSSGVEFYSVTKSDGVWSNLVNINVPIPSGLQPGWQFSLARDESFYFELSEGSSPHDIYYSRFTTDSYQTPQRLSDNVNSIYSDISPFVDPDDEFLIFGSNRPGGYGFHDLYISFKQLTDSWSEAVNMGSTINTSSEDAMPYITQDGLYFFFTTEKAGDQGYNQYWVDASIIEGLRN